MAVSQARPGAWDAFAVAWLFSDRMAARFARRLTVDESQEGEELPTATGLAHLPIASLAVASSAANNILDDLAARHGVGIDQAGERAVEGNSGAGLSAATRRCP